jgi:hypothetical protein
MSNDPTSSSPISNIQFLQQELGEQLHKLQSEIADLDKKLKEGSGLKKVLQDRREEYSSQVSHKPEI